MYGPASKTKPSFSKPEASPPLAARASITRTFNPCCASRIAAVSPPIPAPIMTTRRAILSGAFPIEFVCHGARSALEHSQDAIVEKLLGPFPARTGPHARCQAHTREAQEN